MTRVSTKNSSALITGYTRQYNGTVTQKVPVLTTNWSHRCERSDIVKRIRNPVTGWRDPTSYVVSETETFYDAGTKQLTTINAQGQNYVDRTDGPSTWVVQDDPPVVNIGNRFDGLATKALLKVRDQKVNLSLTIGEAHKSIDTIRDRATSLYRAYRSARKGNFKAAARELGVSPKGRGRKQASNWLELQYGWMPMLMDVRGAYDELTRKTRSNGLTFKVVARDKYLATNTKTTSSLDFTWTAEQTTLLESQMLLWYRIRNEWIVTASSVGLTNPMEIIWEVTPWSFLVDWFLPIGDYLGALTAAQGMDFLGGTQTTRITRETNYRATPNGAYKSSFGTVLPAGFGSARKRSKTVNRNTFASSPIPKAPILNNPFSVGHSLNAIALLRTLR